MDRPQRGTPFLDLLSHLLGKPDARQLGQCETPKPMHPIAKVLALLDGLARDDLAVLPPAQRCRFADLCEHWTKLADARTDAPKAGVLSDLRRGLRDE